MSIGQFYKSERITVQKDPQYTNIVGEEWTPRKGEPVSFITRAGVLYVKPWESGDVFIGIIADTQTHGSSSELYIEPVKEAYAYVVLVNSNVEAGDYVKIAEGGFISCVIAEADGIVLDTGGLGADNPMLVLFKSFAGGGAGFDYNTATNKPTIATDNIVGDVKGLIRHEINCSVFDLDTASTSADIETAIGGAVGFNALLQAINKGVAVYSADTDNYKQFKVNCMTDNATFVELEMFNNSIRLRVRIEYVNGVFYCTNKQSDTYADKTSAFKRPVFDPTVVYAKGDLIYVEPPSYDTLTTPPDVLYPWVMTADNPYNILGKPKTYQAQATFKLEAVRLRSTIDNNTDNPNLDRTCIGNTWVVDEPLAVCQNGASTVSGTTAEYKDYAGGSGDLILKKQHTGMSINTFHQIILNYPFVVISMSFDFPVYTLGSTNLVGGLLDQISQNYIVNQSTTQIAHIAIVTTTGMLNGSAALTAKYKWY